MLFLIERGKTLRKIKALQKYQADYTVIKNIKQQCLNRLQQYVNYSNINIECHRLDQEIKTITSQLESMDVKLNLLMKEL